MASSTCCSRSSIVGALVTGLGGRDPEPGRAYADQTRSRRRRATIAAGSRRVSGDRSRRLGTNGGGFFNANSAHPLENAYATHRLSSRCWRCWRSPSRSPPLFGRFAGDQRQGRALFAAALALLILSVGVMYASRAGRATRTSRAGRSQPTASATQSGGNMEGKEVRFGIADSVCSRRSPLTPRGAVNSMHDSFTRSPAAWRCSTSCSARSSSGGSASAMGMLIFAILAVFIAGLMVGRTPEYLGKKIEGREVKLAVLAILSRCITALGWPRRRAASGGQGGRAQPRSARPLRDPLRHALRPATTAAPSPAWAATGSGPPSEG